MERVKTAPAGRNVALAAAEAPRMRVDEERRADMAMAVYCAQVAVVMEWSLEKRPRQVRTLSGRSVMAKAAFWEVQLKTRKPPQERQR